MVRLRLFLPFALLAALGTSASLPAQVAASAHRSMLAVRVGGMVSGFDPDYGPNRLGGAGAFVDVNLFHGLGVEAEGRWLRFNQFRSINQDNYLVGPRFQMGHLWRATPYVKALVGYGHMNFQDNYASGRFTTIAIGGGVDLRVTRRINLRPFDVEYQQWPNWSEPLFRSGTLLPYGVSAGVSYRIF